MTDFKAEDILNLSVGELGNFLSQQLDQVDVSSREITFEGVHCTTKRKIRFTFKVEEI